MKPGIYARAFGIAAVVSSMALAPALATNAPEFPTKMRVLINLNSQLKDLTLAEAGIDMFAPTSDGHIEAFVTPEERTFLEQDLGYELTILSQDIYQEFESKQGFLGNGNLRDYHNYAENTAFMQDLESNYPDIVHMFHIGTSLENRDMWAIKISDNVMVDEDEPELLYTAIHHAREPVSNETCLQLMEHFAQGYGSDPELTYLVNNRELYFVPIVNPDGYAYVDTNDPYWRKNRRGGYGVDLNRNYGFQWGYDNQGSSPYTGDETYRGASAFSEPETQNIRDLCEAREFIFATNFHTYGEYYLWPWGYIPSGTQENELFEVFGDSLSQDNGYTAGIGSLVLYATNGDADDWMYGEQETKPRAFAITPEIGDDFWPAQYKVQGFVDENIGPAVYLARQAGDPFAVLAPRAPVVSAPPVTGADYRVVWDNRNSEGYDLPVSYRLDEMTGLNRGTDNLESGTDAWLAEGGFVLRTNRYHSSSHSFYGGQDNSNTATMAATTGLAVEPGDVLTMWTWYDIEVDWDYAYAQVSADGGTSWTNLEGNITTNTNPHGNNQGNGITGSSSGWTQGSFPLADFVGSTVIVRFAYVTDQSVLEEGIYIDDVAPVESFDNVETLVSGTTDLHYDLSGRIPGEYYYRVRGTDGDNQLSNWSGRSMAIVTNTALEMGLAPNALEVPRNGQLGYTGQLTNHAGQSQTMQVWGNVTLPSGIEYPGNPVIGPKTISLNAGQTLSLPVTHPIPGVAPLGTYTYTAAAGNYPSAQESAVFTFTVTE